MINYNQQYNCKLHINFSKRLLIRNFSALPTTVYFVFSFPNITMKGHSSVFSNKDTDTCLILLCVSVEFFNCQFAHLYLFLFRFFCVSINVVCITFYHYSKNRIFVYYFKSMTVLFFQKYIYIQRMTC